jgi:hypothetical protein
MGFAKHSPQSTQRPQRTTGIGERQSGTRKETAKPHIVLVSRDPTCHGVARRAKPEGERGNGKRQHQGVPRPVLSLFAFGPRWGPAVPHGTRKARRGPAFALWAMAGLRCASTRPAVAHRTQHARPDLSAIARRATAEGERGERACCKKARRPEGRRSVSALLVHPHPTLSHQGRGNITGLPPWRAGQLTYASCSESGPGRRDPGGPAWPARGGR